MHRDIEIQVIASSHKAREEAINFLPCNQRNAQTQPVAYVVVIIAVFL
jgi:hypothetical protein